MLKTTTQQVFQQYQHHLQHISQHTNFLKVDADCITAQVQQQEIKITMQIKHFDSGILLSRFQGIGDGHIKSNIEHFSHNLAFFVVTAGINRSFFANGQTIEARVGDIWSVSGDIENSREEKYAHNGFLSGFHWDFSPERLSSWQEDGLLRHSPIHAIAPNQIQCLIKNNVSLLPLLRKIALAPYTNDTLSNLDLEASILLLTAQILQFTLPTSKKLAKNKIDDALDIIHQDFAQHLTIHDIARKVGINECYLKRDFKIRTGQTIADYIRQLRLNFAFELITQQGKTPKEAMFFTGYKHQQHFNVMFKKQFGYTPEELSTAEKHMHNE